MDLVVSRYSAGAGWSKALPDWDSPSTLVQVHGPSDVADWSPLEDIDRLYPTAVVVGCSGAGVVQNDEITDEGLTVSVIRFEQVRVSAVFGSVSGVEDQRQIGQELRDKLLAEDPDVASIMLLSGGAITDGDSLSIGVDDGEQGFVAMGGLAGTIPGDDGTFGPTWVLDQNRRPVEGALTMVGLSGDSLVIRTAAKGGWKALGPTRTVTKCDAELLYEMDGRPALDLYKEYLGERSAELPAVASFFPLNKQERGGSEDDWAPAAVISIDEEARSLVLTRKLSEGDTVQMLRGYSGDLFEAAEEAAENLGDVADSPHLAMVVSCLGRRITLGNRTADELTYVRDVLPEQVEMIGIYGMGEFSTSPSRACQLYNYTMTLALIGERVR